MLDPVQVHTAPTAPVVSNARSTNVGTRVGTRLRHARWASLAGWAMAAVLLQSCGGGGSADAAAQPAAAASAPRPTVDSAAQATTPARGSLLSSDWATYPRVVRLGHQADPSRNGRIVASVTERIDGHWQPGFHASDDGGARFRRLSALRSAAFDQGVCCGTLFELPQAVGVLPAGTLLYAVSVGHDTPGVRMEIPIYRSDDGGASFSRLEGAVCGRSDVPRVPGPVALGTQGSGLWEPEFLVAGDGSLACIYSDETVAGKSQVLKLTATLDGMAWTAPRVVLAGAANSDRPGMASVRRLATGHYAMAFELCGLAGQDCSVRIKVSADGLDWGAADDFGSHPQTAAGQSFRHTPTLAWTRTPAHPQGVLALVGQIVVARDGSIDAAANGHAVFVNDRADASGPWRRVEAPIGLASPPQSTNWCQNYSTPLLPSGDGSHLLALVSDHSDDSDGGHGSGCVVRFGEGPLGP